jgi:hypothetical protein
MSQLLHTRRGPQARVLARWCAGGALALGLALRPAPPSRGRPADPGRAAQRGPASVLLGVTAPATAWWRWASAA